MNGPFRRTYPHLGDARPPTLETLPQAVAQNVAIARSRTRARIMAVVKADGYGHGACTVARAAVAAGAEWLGTTDIAEASELRATTSQGGDTGSKPHWDYPPDLRKRRSVRFQEARASNAHAPHPHGLGPAGQEEGGTSTMRSVSSA